MRISMKWKERSSTFLRSTISASTIGNITGVVYLFRENTTATVERVNENVVKVEGPLLDVTKSYYAPSHSAYIYILNCNRNVILILNTTNLAVTQIAYEPLIESDNHSIVGIHNVVLTMAFDG
ncbi:hypothetical protein PENTCL1PPCAC_24505, partial [Pristionchus entomophagus]